MGTRITRLWLQKQQLPACGGVGNGQMISINSSTVLSSHLPFHPLLLPTSSSPHVFCSSPTPSALSTTSSSTMPINCTSCPVICPSPSPCPASLLLSHRSESLCFAVYFNLRPSLDFQLFALFHYFMLTFSRSRVVIGCFGSISDAAQCRSSE